MTTSNTKVITGKVRLSYANVWEPKSIDEDQTPKYSASLIIPKSDTKTIKKIKDAIEVAKKEGTAKWGGKIPANLKMPLRDGDFDRPDDDAYADSYFINASCLTRPGMLNRRKMPITNPEEVYSGCYVLASITFYAFNKNGNRGIAAGLNNLLKVEDGENLGGGVSAEVDFADVELPEEDYDGMLS